MGYPVAFEARALERERQLTEKAASLPRIAAAPSDEAIISALAIQNGFMPGTANTQEIDPALGSRYLTGGERGTLKRVVSNSFGFGGSNCSLVLERGS